MISDFSKNIRNTVLTILDKEGWREVVNMAILLAVCYSWWWWWWWTYKLSPELRYSCSAGNCNVTITLRNSYVIIAGKIIAANRGGWLQYFCLLYFRNSIEITIIMLKCINSFFLFLFLCFFSLFLSSLCFFVSFFSSFLCFFLLFVSLFVCLFLFFLSFFSFFLCSLSFFVLFLSFFSFFLSFSFFLLFLFFFSFFLFFLSFFFFSFFLFFSFLFGVAHAPFACQRWGLPHRLAQCAIPGKGVA